MAIYKTQTEAKVYQVINEAVSSLGYEVIRVKNFQQGKKKVLQLMIERKDGANISVGDCDVVSRQTSVILDVEDIIRGEYNLEVSSPGLNRPLTRIKDFANAIGKYVRFIVRAGDRRKFIGLIKSVEGETITVLSKDADSDVEIAFNEVEEAFLQYFDSDIK